MPVNKMLLQELNPFNRKFLVLSPIAGVKCSPLLRTPMKVAHRISLKNKMSLNKFQVIWQP